jgi:hypothetical protein
MNQVTDTTVVVEATKRRANSAYAFSKVDGKLVFDFGAVGKVAFDPEKASAENRARAMLHGFKQRIIDAGALEAGADGKVDVVAKFAEMARVADHLMSGSSEWNVKATGEGVGASSLVSQALVKIGKFADVVAANTWVKSVADTKFGGEMKKARDFLATAQVVRDGIRLIEDERAAERIKANPTLNPDDMLNEI